MKWLEQHAPDASYDPRDENEIKQTILTAYNQKGQLDPRDVPYARIYSRASYPGVSLSSLIKGLPITELDVKEVTAAVAGLQGEELMVYQTYRFLSCLYQTEAFFLRVGDWTLHTAYTLPPPRELTEDAKGVEDPTAPLEPLQWDPQVTEERKLQGLGLMADLTLGLHNLRSFHGTTDYIGDGHNVPVSGSLSQLWYKILRSPQSILAGYKDMLLLYRKIQNPEAAELHKEFQLEYPGTVDLSITAFLSGVSDSLHSHLERNLVQLPTFAQAYLQYIDRLLMNYRYYGTVGLRVSDLSEGDAVFSRVGGSVLPTLSHRGLSTAAAMQGLVDSYLIKVPTDAEIMTRIVALAESQGHGGVMRPWPPVLPAGAHQLFPGLPGF